MTKKNLKDLVEEIKKVAAPPPPKKPGYVSSGVSGTTPSATPTGPRTLPGHGGGAGGGHRALPGHGGRPTGAGGGRGGGGGGVGNTSIMAMQHALQDLAADVSAQINLQDAGSGDPTKEADARRRDAFGIFLTKNYMRNTGGVQGVEYDPDAAKVKMEDKKPGDPTRLSIVMDTMNRIGKPKPGETFADGIWGFRTNAAVRDAYAFAYGLLQFINDTNRFATKKITTQAFSEGALQDLAQYAKTDPNTLSQTQKAEAAPKITEHVKNIKQMYEDVKRQFLLHPAYQQYIEYGKAFKTYKPGVSKDQLDVLRKAFPNGIDIKVKNVSTNIKVDDLLSPETLKTWIHRAVPEANPSPDEVIQAVYATNAKIPNMPYRGF